MSYVPAEQDLDAINRYLDDLLPSEQREDFVTNRLQEEPRLARLLHRFEVVFCAQPSTGINGRLRQNTKVISDAVMQAIAIEKADEMVSLLNGLNEDAQMCFVLRTLNQLKYDLIADTLHLTPSAAMAHVHMVRKQILSKLSHDANADYSPIRRKGAS